MEGYERKEGMDNDREEIYSKAVRAGKRTYFFDVKATRNNDYYLTITESKKRFDNDGNQNFEKHKIFPKTFFMCINLLLYSQNLRPLNYYFYSKQRRTVESLVNFYILFTNSFFIDLFFQVVFELKFLLIFQNKGNFISDII